jgi:cytoskeletal protein CcmA (bactofilin family)
MSATYVPTAYYHPTVVLPSPSDPATAASVNAQGFKYLSDNDKYLLTDIAKYWDGTNITVPSGVVSAYGGIVSIGPLDAFSTSNLQGAVQCGSTLAVAGAVSFSSTLSVTSTATVGSLFSSGLSNTGSAVVSVDLTVGNNLTINGKLNGAGGTVVVDEDFQVEGDIVGEVSFADDVVFGGTIGGYGVSTIPIDASLEITGSVTVGEGSIVPFYTRRLFGTGPETITAATPMCILLSATGTQNYTVSDTGAVDGSWIMVANRSDQQANIFTPSATDDLTLDPNQMCMFVYFGSGIGWRCMMFLDFVPGL